MDFENTNGQMHSHYYHVQKTNLKTRKVPSLEFLPWVQDTHRRLETKIQPSQMGARGPDNNLFVLGPFSIENVWKIAKNAVFSIFCHLNPSMNPINDFCSLDTTPLDTFHPFSHSQKSTVIYMQISVLSNEQVMMYIFLFA